MKQIKLVWENPSEDKPTSKVVPPVEVAVKLIVKKLEDDFNDKVISWEWA